MAPAPNVLVIMSDEHQGRAMGCAARPDCPSFVQTPNLDALAARGVRFTDAYTPSPICVPARSAFATGRYVHNTRHWDNAMPYDGRLPGWGHALQRADIAVESVGKLHYRSESDPAGFDVEHLPMMVAGGVGMVWGSIRAEDQRPTLPGRMLGDYIGPGDSTYTRYDTSVVERTKQWFQDRQQGPDDRPWCLFVGLVAPHFPLIVPQEFYDLYPPGAIPEPKLHPSQGYTRHPWVQKQLDQMDNEASFKDAEERQRALACYYGLCSFLDHNVGQILEGLTTAGFGAETTVIYTSDHGDNVGARGLWGKSNMYQESVHVPLLMAGPDVAPSVCRTPVSLVDLSVTLTDHFGASFAGERGAEPLSHLARQPDQPDRVVFSEYHAVGSVSGAYMIRKGRWKYIHYVDFAPELFDLRADPEERVDLAASPQHRAVLAELHQALCDICDPEATSERALADQTALVARHGGPGIAATLGGTGASPTP